MDARSLFKRNAKYARESLGLREWLYYISGTDGEYTFRDNERAFARLCIVPKLFPSSRDALNLKTILVGREVDFPIGISPSAYHQVLHPEGELATASAAARLNLCYAQSLYSNRSVEEVSAAYPNSMRWMNMRAVKERDYLADVVRRAEKCGYGALVVTVDSPIIGNKLSSKRIPFTLPPHLKPGNLPVSSPDTKEEDKVIHLRPTTWEEIRWIKSLTKLPIVLKGIQTAEDAMLAIQNGASAIQISNHGGRQMDYVPASLEALAEISEAVGGQIDIFIDGGFRSGVDVFKALALGAKAVFLGRAVVFGLHYGGCDGVVEVLETMKEELELAMMQTGCTDVNHIPRNVVRRVESVARL